MPHLYHLRVCLALCLSLTYVSSIPRSKLDRYVASSPNRTVIFIEKVTQSGQDLFIRGGISDSQRPECIGITDATVDPCAVGMRVRSLGTISTYDAYNSWKVNDNHVDWHGPEVNQGTYSAVTAEGTALAWTTSDVYSPAYQELNQWGDHNWMVDMEMDCSETENGWIEFKAYLSNDATGWESDITSDAVCTGTIGGTTPYSSLNHFARCGYINRVTYGDSACYVDSFPE